MHTYQILYVTAVACAIAEMFTTTFILLGFAVGIALTGLAEQLLGSTSYSRDLLIFTIVSGLSVFLFRKVFSDSQDTKANSEDINQY